MTSKFANLVKQTTTGTGTGNLTLASMSGYQTAATAFGTGATTDVFWYTIVDSINNAYEMGTGHMSDATTLVRDTVVFSSNANAKVNFSAGTKIVLNSAPQSLVALLESMPVTMGNIYQASPANSTIVLISYAEYAMTINQIDNLVVSAGSITASLQINGVNVTGLSSLAVTSTPQFPTASAANTVAVGQRVTLVLSSNSGATNLEGTTKITRT